MNREEFLKQLKADQEALYNYSKDHLEISRVVLAKSKSAEKAINTLNSLKENILKLVAEYRQEHEKAKMLLDEVDELKKKGAAIEEKEKNLRKQVSELEEKLKKTAKIVFGQTSNDIVYENIEAPKIDSEKFLVVLNNVLDDVRVSNLTGRQAKILASALCIRNELPSDLEVDWIFGDSETSQVFEILKQ